MKNETPKPLEQTKAREAYDIKTPADKNLLLKKTSEKKLSNEAEAMKIAKKMSDYLQGAEKYLYKTYNLSPENQNRPQMALQLFKSAQILRAKILNSQATKLEELVGEYTILITRISEYTKEGVKGVEQAKIDDASKNEAFGARPTQDKSITETVEVSPRPPTETEKALDDLTIEAEGSVEVSSAVESITGEKVDLSSTVTSVEQQEEQKDEEKQKENQVSSIIDQINSDTEPKGASKLISQLWDLNKNKFGSIKSIYPHSDNANLVLEFRNGSKKIVSPESIARYKGRSFEAYTRIYLKNIEEYKDNQAIEIGFGDAAPVETPKEAKKEGGDKLDKFLSEKSPSLATDILLRQDTSSSDKQKVIL